MIRRAEPVSVSPSAGDAAYGAGQAAAPASSVNATLPRAMLVDPNKRLAVGDQVSIEIVEDREAPLPKMITATGDIDLTPLGRVHVAGSSRSEAEQAIKRKLEEDYYYTATVRISIDRINPVANVGKVTLTGEIMAPGVLDILDGDRVTVNEAILRRGNFTKFAKQEEVQLSRGKGNRAETFTINVKEIQRKGRGENDMVLQDGDRIFVKKAWFRLE